MKQSDDGHPPVAKQRDGNDKGEGEQCIGKKPTAGWELERWKAHSFVELENRNSTVVFTTLHLCQSIIFYCFQFSLVSVSLPKSRTKKQKQMKREEQKWTQHGGKVFFQLSKI